MKTILVPTEQHDLMATTLETALLLARQFESHIEGFALRPALQNFLAVDPYGGVAMDVAKEAEAESAKQARTLFESFMQSHGVTASTDAVKAISYSWWEDAPEGDNIVGNYGRVFDVIVLGRPGFESGDPHVSTFETALFESGRPILLAPRTVPQTIGTNVLIAWNGSTEQTRTTAFAMPILRRAQRVTVLTTEGNTIPGPTGEQLVRSLHFNDIPATHVYLKDSNVGEAILNYAAAEGCDLLIKGAYTQSRLRQMIFGGATRHILGHAKLPVLMAH